MLRRTGTLTLLASAAMLLPAAQAAAQASIQWDNYCTTGAFEVCASVRATLGADNQTITMQLWNLEGSAGFEGADAGLISSIGLFYAGIPDWSGTYDFNVVHVENSTTEEDITTHWRTNGNNIQADVYLNGKGEAGVTGCTPLGSNQDRHWSTCQSFPGTNYVEFRFTNLSSDFLAQSSFTATNVGLAWHAQVLDNDESIKCYTTDDSGNESVQHPCVPSTTVPEPATVVLMASGLLAMAGAGVVRRRKQQG